MYFHSDYLRFLNIAEYFVSSCDHENNFINDEFPEDYEFIPDSHDVKMLDTCF